MKPATSTRDHASPAGPDEQRDPGDHLYDAQQHPTPSGHLQCDDALRLGEDEAAREQRGQPVDRVPHPEDYQEHADPDDHPEPA